MNIEITEVEARIILDVLGRTQVQGLETMRAILALTVKLQTAIPVEESSGEPDSE